MNRSFSLFSSLLLLLSPHTGERLYVAALQLSALPGHGLVGVGATGRLRKPLHGRVRCFTVLFSLQCELEAAPVFFCPQEFLCSFRFSWLFRGEVSRLDVLKSFTATPTLPLASPALCCPRCLKAAVQFGAFSQKSVRKKVRPACFVVVSKWFKLLKIRRMLAGPGVKNLYAFKSLAYFETTK